MRSAAAPLRLVLLSGLLLALPGVSIAQPLAGDLDGDGLVGSFDETLLSGLYGHNLGESDYDPAADLNGDDSIDVVDLALFGTSFGAAGGDVDIMPPELLVTLNDIPDDMNDLLVVPPEGFLVTLRVDSAGGSLLDPASLSVTSSQDVGPFPAGTDLGPQFSVTPPLARFEIPAGSELARTSHYLSVSVRDVAGNQASGDYGFAVRDFDFGEPLGNLQTIFLDFDQDRSLGPEIDFLEDLREYGLSSSSAPALESQMRDWVVSEILARVHPYYGRNPDGSPGPDAANVVFVDTPPAGDHSRLCVGGESYQGGAFLGSASLDVNNLDETSDECGPIPVYGVFPQAMDNLWGANAELHAAFDPLDPGAGGVPVGEDPLDAVVLDPGWNAFAATQAEIDRYGAIVAAVEAFSQVLATAIAHETGHSLGLTAPGPAPGGLWGGTSGGSKDHNVATAGGTPSQNYLMNPGGSFSFEEMTGLGGSSLPVFRPLSWAYLRDRIVINPSVTGLFPAPSISSVSPSPAVYQGGSVQITVTGENFFGTPVIELAAVGDPTPNPVLNVMLLDSTTLVGDLLQFLVPPNTYEVRLVNPDDQIVVAPDPLVVQ